MKSMSVQVEDKDKNKVKNEEKEQPTGVTCKPPLPQASGIKLFKKCQSATFQIDGHTYTIGMNFHNFPTIKYLQRILHCLFDFRFF